MDRLADLHAAAQTGIADKALFAWAAEEIENLRLAVGNNPRRVLELKAQYFEQIKAELLEQQRKDRGL